MPGADDSRALPDVSHRAPRWCPDLHRRRQRDLVRSASVSKLRSSRQPRTSRSSPQAIQAGSKAAGIITPRTGASNRRSRSTRGVAEASAHETSRELGIRGVRLVEVHPEFEVARAQMRSTVANDGCTVSCSWRHSVACDVPARRASSRIDSPARRRAVRMTAAAEADMFAMASELIPHRAPR